MPSVLRIISAQPYFAPWVKALGSPIDRQQFGHRFPSGLCKCTVHHPKLKKIDEEQGRPRRDEDMYIAMRRLLPGGGEKTYTTAHARSVLGRKSQLAEVTQSPEAQDAHLHLGARWRMTLCVHACARGGLLQNIHWSTLEVLRIASRTLNYNPVAGDIRIFVVLSQSRPQLNTRHTHAHTYLHTLLESTMKPTATIFAILTAAISAQALEIEHHDPTHTNSPHLSQRSNHPEHHTHPESDPTVVARDLLLDFSTRELVEELEARLSAPGYNHLDRRDPSRLGNWVRKQVGKITGGSGGGVVDDGTGGVGAGDMGVTGP
ncbi:hypothetical protein BJ165DRAFT_1402939 [Panaeolus papilionaceus]|nr:hypothetical protein BJ165DRAFT_1402939 [Panaeolus papilionaceus]